MDLIFGMAVGHHTNIGGSRGHCWCMPPKGPDSFILTYKFFEMKLPRELVPPYEVGTSPPTGNPGSTTD